MPLTNVNEPGAIDSNLHEVTASTMTLQQPANANPSTVGLGGVLFNLIDVAQGYVFVPSAPCTRSNVALAANGSTAVASSSHSSGVYPAASALTGDRTP